MIEDDFIFIIFGEKAVLREGKIVKIGKDFKKKKDDIEFYMDKIVKVPEQLSKEEAEKLIREKKAYKFNPSRTVDEITKKVFNEYKGQLSHKEIKNKVMMEVRNLIKIRDSNIFSENIMTYQKALNLFKKKMKQKIKNKEIGKVD